MLKIACLQLTSSADLLENIVKVRGMVERATAMGAGLVATPENTFLIEESGKDRVFYKQHEHPAVKASAEMARKNNIWLLIGSVAILSTQHSALKTHSPLTYNRSLLFNPEGEIMSHYDKIHLFDVEVGDGQVYRESSKIIAGDKAVIAPTPWAKLGMTICYDVRFPQLYRALAKAGAGIIAVPAAFTQVTGEAHWHVLLRARAIETGCFIIAPAQTGTHAGGRKTYGHSLVVDPWGKIIADGGTEEGIISADIDLSEVAKMRGKLPNLQHDREFCHPAFIAGSGNNKDQMPQ
ncbi:MAG: carbon-nitrogen hydrolase family protein [Pseudomonadota bacterium]